MLDCFSKKPVFHLVVDQVSYGVLTSSVSLPVANAVSSGILNSSVMTVLLIGKHDTVMQISKDVSKNYILLKQIQHATAATDMNLGKVVDSTPNKQLFDIESVDRSQDSDWLSKRELANMRQRGILSLETKIERYLTRVKSFTADHAFHSIMRDQLRLCEPSSDNYTDIIREWAEIVGISPQAAYQQLKYQLESSEFTIARLHALWTKYVEKVNQFNTDAEISKCINYDLEMELRAGAQ